MPVKSSDFQSLWNCTWLEHMSWNYWAPLQHLEQHLSSLRGAAPQSKPIAMMCSTRPCLCIYFFFNACHSCWIFRLSCLSNHLSEWKIWEVNKFLSRHLPPSCGLSLSLNKAVTASGEIGVLLWCTGHPQVLNTDLYMLQRCYFTCCIYHVTGIMRLSSVLFSMVFCVKSFYKIIIKSCKVAFRRKKQKPKNQIKIWLRASP